MAENKIPTMCLSRLVLPAVLGLVCGQLARADRQFLTTAFGREAAAFIRRHAEGPWFLYVAFNAPDVPMTMPPGYAWRIDQRATSPFSPAGVAGRHLCRTGVLPRPSRRHRG